MPLRRYTPYIIWMRRDADRVEALPAVAATGNAARQLWRHAALGRRRDVAACGSAGSALQSGELAPSADAVSVAVGANNTLAALLPARHLACYISVAWRPGCRA